MDVLYANLDTIWKKEFVWLVRKQAHNPKDAINVIHLMEQHVSYVTLDFIWI
jgi:hypothetical protein